MTKHTWQNIYEAGEQLNRYPYDFIVSNYFRHRPRKTDGEPIRVLDLGCGAGNHALFCAENGANVLATDFSGSALKVVEQRAKQKQLADRITTQPVDFEDFQLDLPDDAPAFDMAIDRLAVSHVSLRYATPLYNRVYELLAPGGIVLANLFTTGHTHKDFGSYDEQADIWHNFEQGIFEHLHTAYFYTEQEVKQLLQKFELLSLVRRTEQDTINNDTREIWEIVAQKQG